MTLDVMLAAHDEAALEAVASRGLVRRAARDAAAGKATVRERGPDEATVEADGETVVVRAAGPRDSRCGCPAVGVCRHVLLAILALRDAPGTAAAPPAPDVAAELVALEAAELARFAGADLAAAVALAQSSTATTIRTEGASLAVDIPDAPAPVVFLAGQGLKGAIYKGPKTRSRLMIAAAAMLVRLAAGQSLPDHDIPEESAPLSGADLAEVSQVIETAVTAVLTGNGRTARERLFDLAISARAQSAPRLSALLRDLSRQAALSETRDIAFSETDFLGDAALAYALTTALKANPDDRLLTGAIARDYVSAEPMQVVLLSVAAWHAASGARGLRVHGYDMTAGRWITTGPARAAGADPSFRPAVAYDTPLWSAGAFRTLVGTSLTIEEPRISEDGQMPLTLAATPADAGPDLDKLEDIGAAHRTWTAARYDLGHRAGTGLRRAALAQPLLIRPQGIGKPAFSDLDQVYRIGVEDRDADRLTLEFPASALDRADWLAGTWRRDDAILCDVWITRDGLRLVPLSLIRTVSREGITNLTLDPLGKSRSASLRDFLSRTPASSAQAHPDAISQTLQALSDAVVPALALGQVSALAQLEHRLDDLGLATLARACASFAAEPTPALALHAVYLAQETYRVRACLH